MRKSRFSEEQIIGMIREHGWTGKNRLLIDFLANGVKTADIFRKYGLSDATFYK